MWDVLGQIDGLTVGPLALLAIGGWVYLFSQKEEESPNE